MRPIRIAVAAPRPHDACSYYRTMGPLGRLSKTMHLDIRYLSGEPEWSDLACTDILFMQRYNTPAALEWAHIARKMGVKVYLDFDDNMFAIPMHHPLVMEFARYEGVLKQILSLADAVTVSTPAIADSYRPFCPVEPVVIPNAVDEKLSDPAGKRIYNPKYLAWRGGMSHREDIELARQYLSAPEYDVHYFGHMSPWFRKTRDTFTPWGGLLDYFNKLQNSPASTLFVPLVDDVFNRGKSNCAWLEATWANMAVVHFNDGPDILLPEFDRPGVLGLRDWLANAPLARAREESLQYILDNLTLGRVNVQRQELIESLAV